MSASSSRGGGACALYGVLALVYVGLAADFVTDKVSGDWCVGVSATEKDASIVGDFFPFILCCGGSVDSFVLSLSSDVSLAYAAASRSSLSGTAHYAFMNRPLGPLVYVYAGAVRGIRNSEENAISPSDERRSDSGSDVPRKTGNMGPVPEFSCSFHERIGAALADSLAFTPWSPK
ncbi:hypothetical protein MRX96_004006 [Rhipicephalus microplus]